MAWDTAMSRKDSEMSIISRRKQRACSNKLSHLPRLESSCYIGCTLVKHWLSIKLLKLERCCNLDGRSTSPPSSVTAVGSFVEHKGGSPCHEREREIDL